MFVNSSHTEVSGDTGIKRVKRRGAPALLFLGAAGVLVVAASLEPDPSGLGTHEQLGLPRCGFRMAMGLPCVSCGMTTAFAHAANGNLSKAFFTQPMGAMLAVVDAIAVLVFGYAAVVGMPVTGICRMAVRPAMFVILGVLMLMSWIYTILIQ